MLASYDWSVLVLSLVRGEKKHASRPHCISNPKKKQRRRRGDREATERRFAIPTSEDSEMDEEQRDMKAHKAYYQRVDFVSNSLQGIPQLCPCGSITKQIVDKYDTYDYLPGKRYFIFKDFENDGLHYRQPWVIGVQEEVERLKLKVLRHENLLRECEALKEQVKMLVKRVSELEDQ